MEELETLIAESVRARGLRATARLLGLAEVPVLRMANHLPVKHATREVARLNAHILAAEARV